MLFCLYSATYCAVIPRLSVRFVGDISPEWRCTKRRVRQRQQRCVRHAEFAPNNTKIIKKSAVHRCNFSCPSRFVRSTGVESRELMKIGGNDGMIISALKVRCSQGSPALVLDAGSIYQHHHLRAPVASASRRWLGLVPPRSYLQSLFYSGLVLLTITPCHPYLQLI